MNCNFCDKVEKNPDNFSKCINCNDNEIYCDNCIEICYYCNNKVCLIHMNKCKYCKIVLCDTCSKNHKDYECTECGEFICKVCKHLHYYYCDACGEKYCHVYNKINFIEPINSCGYIFCRKCLELKTEIEKFVCMGIIEPK